MIECSPPAMPPADSRHTASFGVLRTVARNSAFILGAQILLKVLALLFSIFVVRRLGATHFGQYSAVMAYVALFAIFTDLGMAPYAVREIAEDRDRIAWLLPNMIAIRLLLSLLIMLIAPASAYWLGKESGMIVGISVASAGQLLYAIQGPLDSALTARERLDYTATFTVINQLIFWGIGALLLLRGSGFIGLIAASLVGVAASGLLSWWVLFRRLNVGRLSLSAQYWPGILRSALPFGISDIAYAFMGRFDTVLMSLVLSDVAVGWYNVPLTLIAMTLLLAQSVATAMYPTMVRGHTLDPESLSTLMQRALRALLLVCLPITVGGTILADRIIFLLYTPEFTPSISVLRIVLWALPSLFLLELFGRAANTLHMERAAAKLNLLNAGLTVALNLILVPTMGIVGGAIALVAGRTIRLLQYWRLLGNQRIVGHELPVLFKVLLATGLMGAAVFLLRETPLILAIAAGASIYGALVLGLKAIGRQELRALGQVLTRKAEIGGVK